MGIIAVLMGLGITGLNQFRGTIELQNAYSDVISALETLQNRARNAVATPSTTPGVATVTDYSGMAFLQDTYDFKICRKAGSLVTCTTEASDLKPAEISNISFSVTADCTTIAFARLTGDIVSIDGSGNVITEGNCTIRLIHNQTSNARELYIDLTSNNIRIQENAVSN